MKKTFKKILCMMLVVVTCLTSVPMSEFVGFDWSWLDFSVKARALAETGQCGDNVYWNYDKSTGELIISGTGSMTNYSDSHNYGSWNKSPFYQSEVKEVVIENGVTTVGDEAFYSCRELKSVTIGNGVVTIGNGAFYSCSELRNITLPSSLEIIDYLAFGFCDNITQLVIPDSVITIGDYAFSTCGLVSVYIGKNVATISEGAFAGCVSLKKVNIPNNLTTIEAYAFNCCANIESVAVPKSVKKIGNDAFNGCSKLKDVWYDGSESEWKIIASSAGFLPETNIHYGTTDYPNIPDNPNNDDNLNKVTIDFTTDTYEVEVDNTVKIYAKVTCNNGIENLDMVWENLDSEGIELVSANKYENGSETEWVYYATIQGLKEGTYYINLRDNNSTVFDTSKIVVSDNDDIIDDPYHPTTPSKPRIDCDDILVEYKQNVDFDKRKKFTINGEITNYNEEHTLTDISITIKSPDANKAVFKTDDGYKDSVTFPLGKTIEVGKAQDFKCTAYVKRGYNPPNGTEDLTFTCILHGKLDGKEVNGVYSTFNVKIKNLSYKNPNENKNWTPTSLIGLLDILFTSKTPKGKLYIECYPDKSAASTLKWQYTSIKATNAVISTIELSDALSEAIDVAVELTELGNISAIKIQDEIFGLAEDALEEVMGIYQDIAMNEIKMFYDGEIKRLLESKEYKEYLEWYSQEVNCINGNSTKVTKRCPIDIFVTDKEGHNVLKIENSDIKVYDEYASAYLSGEDKILYLPNDIGHSIKTVATDNGEMDYIIESYSKQGEYRIIEYNNIPLTKGKSYTATVPLDMTSNIDMFNPKSEDGKIIKADKDETEHKYGDKDKNCQLCGYDRTKGCSCNCHKGGISGFFFKIILFFQKIFKTNKTCSCGVAHY